MSRVRRPTMSCEPLPDCETGAGSQSWEPLPDSKTGAGSQPGGGSAAERWTVEVTGEGGSTALTTALRLAFAPLIGTGEWRSPSAVVSASSPDERRSRWVPDSSDSSGISPVGVVARAVAIGGERRPVRGGDRRPKTAEGDRRPKEPPCNEPPAPGARSSPPRDMARRRRRKLLLEESCGFLLSCMISCVRYACHTTARKRLRR